MTHKTYKKVFIFLVVGTILAVGGYVAALNGWFGGGAAIPEDTMTRGLVGYWNMDEGGGQTAKDLSGNGNNGTLGAAATAGADDPLWSKGKNGGALKFDGKNDYVDAGNGVELQLSTVGTLSVWIKTTAVGSGDGLQVMNKRNVNGDNSPSLIISAGATGVARIMADGPGYYSGATGVTNVKDGSWHHIVGTFSNGVMNIFLDGKLDGTGTWDNRTLSNTGSSWNIGYHGAWNLYFNGSIDDVRIYNRALSAEEIRYHYNRGGPVAEWKFDEGSGTKAFDSMENNNNGTLTGATHLPTWAAGKYGSALTFDGTEDYVSRAYDADFDFGAGSFTIGGWFKHNTIAASSDYLLSRYDTDQGFKVWMDDSGDMCFGIDDDATWDTDDSACTSGIDYDDNLWHYFSAYKNGTTGIYLYIDGILVSSDTSLTDTATLTSNSASLYIGSDSPTPGSYWEGSIDDVRIYNYARSADEIRLDYNSGYAVHLGPTGKTCAEDPAGCMDYGLVGNWSMDEGGASTAKDSSGNNKNGTLTGGPLWTKGKKGNAIKLDGANDYVSIGNVYNGVKSVSFWLKAGNITQKILDLNATEYIEVSSGTITATGAGWVSPAIYVDGKEATIIDTAWHHVIITTATGVNASAINLAKFSTNYFNGILDEVRIYNRALSFEEINYLYNEKKPVVQYDMDEGFGATAQDSQGGFDITFPADSSEQPAWSKP